MKLSKLRVMKASKFYCLLAMPNKWSTAESDVEQWRRAVMSRRRQLTLTAAAVNTYTQDCLLVVAGRPRPTRVVGLLHTDFYSVSIVTTHHSSLRILEYLNAIKLQPY